MRVSRYGLKTFSCRQAPPRRSIYPCAMWSGGRWTQCSAPARAVAATLPVSISDGCQSPSIPSSSLAGEESSRFSTMLGPLSWMALYAHDGSRVVKEAFYFPTQGSHHVAALLHALRGDWARSPNMARTEPRPLATDVIRDAIHFHRRLVEPLLLPGELCLGAEQQSPLWGSRFRWWRRSPVCVFHRSTLMLTDRAFFYARARPPLGENGYVFDDNLSCYRIVPKPLVRRSDVCRAGIACRCVEATFANPSGPSVELVFGERQEGSAARWAEALSHSWDAGGAEILPRSCRERTN